MPPTNRPYLQHIDVFAMRIHLQKKNQRQLQLFCEAHFFLLLYVSYMCSCVFGIYAPSRYFFFTWPTYGDGKQNLAQRFARAGRFLHFSKWGNSIVRYVCGNPRVYGITLWWMRSPIVMLCFVLIQFPSIPSSARVQKEQPPHRVCLNYRQRAKVHILGRALCIVLCFAATKKKRMLTKNCKYTCSGHVWRNPLFGIPSVEFMRPKGELVNLVDFYFHSILFTF